MKVCYADMRHVIEQEFSDIFAVIPLNKSETVSMYHQFCLYLNKREIGNTK